MYVWTSALMFDYLIYELIYIVRNPRNVRYDADGEEDEDDDDASDGDDDDDVFM
jgi:hypothetical protein